MAILPICKKKDLSILTSIEDFSNLGYRTLTFALKNFEAFDDHCSIESDMELIAATGVEDLL